MAHVASQQDAEQDIERDGQEKKWQGECRRTQGPQALVFRFREVGSAQA
jgi:hypothetical protein